MADRKGYKAVVKYESKEAAARLDEASRMTDIVCRGTALQITRLSQKTPVDSDDSDDSDDDKLLQSDNTLYITDITDGVGQKDIRNALVRFGRIETVFMYLGA